MNGKLYLVALLIVTTFASCSCLPSGYSKWEHDVEHDGLRFDRVRYSKSGTIIADLSEDTVIQDCPCRKGWVHFNSDWTLQNCTLSEPMTLCGVHIPAKTWIELYKNGALKYCAYPDNMVVQGYECIGTGGGPNGFHTGFYESGRLKYFFTPDDVVIRGIPCNGGWFSLIGLHENGGVMECSLARDTVIDSKTYKKGTRYLFDDQGHVVGIR